MRSNPANVTEIQHAQENEPTVFDTTDKETYKQLKKAFLHEVYDTVNRCEKGCINQDNQERNFSVSDHPEIAEKRKKIDSFVEHVFKELEFIDQKEHSPAERVKYLKQYGQGLQKLGDLMYKPYNPVLPLTILMGKMKKHWVPMAEKLSKTINENEVASVEQHNAEVSPRI
ncbi:MAG TPA: hypothetical protein VHZ76_02945 [Gammaproteobacteria bacterium]|jgi:hypothetical protein|nr:hypothetical protein [Gammaproteobacteria bacterium]